MATEDKNTRRRSGRATLEPQNTCAHSWVSTGDSEYCPKCSERKRR